MYPRHTPEDDLTPSDVTASPEAAERHARSIDNTVTAFEALRDGVDFWIVSQWADDFMARLRERGVTFHRKRGERTAEDGCSCVVFLRHRMP